MAASPSSFTPGTRLGKYEIIRALAMGGMAELFLARARGIEGFKKVVVLKRILPQYAEDENFVTMFLDEARLAATLQHPNIAQVYDIGVIDDSYYFTMEYVQGPSLLEVLKKDDWSQKGLPLEAALAISVGLLAGLQYAHDKTDDDGSALGIVHRDVSPANVMVTYDGFVKLVDFGIAKAASQQAVTQSSTLKGKLRYMSPEQVAAISLDRRSDLFAVGVLLYEITSGYRLLDAENALAVVRMIADGDFAPPSARRKDYPKPLEKIVMRALQVDRDQRYVSARDMQLDLEAFALSQRLSLSPLQLASYVERLFGKKPRQASAPIITNARHAVSLVSTPISAAAPPQSAPPAPVISTQPTAKRGSWIAAAAVVVIGVAGMLAMMRSSPRTEPTTNEMTVVPINPTPPSEEMIGDGIEVGKPQTDTDDKIVIRNDDTTDTDDKIVIRDDDTTDTDDKIVIRDDDTTHTDDKIVIRDDKDTADRPVQPRERRTRNIRRKRENAGKAARDKKAEGKKINLDSPFLPKARDKKDKSNKTDLDSPFLPGGSR